MNKIFFYLILILFISGCSLNKNSKFWTSSQNIQKEKKTNYEKIFVKDKALERELNTNVTINLGKISDNNYITREYFNNDGRLNYDGVLKKSSRYKFSKIKNFYKFEPKISFHKNNIIFFDKRGSILKFDKNSKLIWKKNYYSKSEKKLKPILQFANNNNILVVADNISKYYALNINNGELLWSRNNFAPFNSQIKIFQKKFFIIDYSNTLRCFSLKDGKELWSIETENSLIRSQKKLSMVIVNDLLYFKNSLGDINAVNIDEGELLWQLPTQSSLIYEAAFSLETSDLITDGNTLFFSNNKNQFFSIDIKTGSFNWKNKINSNLRSSIIGNFLVSITLEGYLVLTEKKSGNIIRVTDVFDSFKIKDRAKIKPTGFVVGLENIYLSTSNGRLLVINISSGKTILIKKIYNNKISKPFIQNENLFLIKNNGIIRLN